MRVCVGERREDASASWLLLFYVVARSCARLSYCLLTCGDDAPITDQQRGRGGACGVEVNQRMFKQDGAMIIDVHVHIVGLDQARGCYIAPKMLRGPAYAVLSRALGLNGTPQDQLDEAYLDLVVDLAHTPRLDGVGLLALDGVYDEAGELDMARTSVMVSNDYCLAFAKAHPKFLPVCSINPQRKDALDELERVVEAGTVALKALPNSQGFDPGNERYRPFFRRVAELGVPFLTHTSFEHTIPPLDQAFGKPERLVVPLEEGVTVIAAHCASAGVGHPFREDYWTWESMLETHPNLYGDISAMASVSRFPYIHKVLKSELATSRVILGSDFPIPVSPLVFLRHIGMEKVRQLSGIANPLARNIETFRALGVPEAVFERTASLLKLPKGWVQGNSESGA